MEHPKSGDVRALAMVYLGLGPIIGAMTSSIGMWTIMFMIAPPIGLAIAYIVGGPCCIAAFAAAYAFRRLDAPERMALVAMVGAAASYIASCVAMDADDTAMNVLMTIGGGIASIICDRMAAEPLPHKQILFALAGIALTWTVLWGLYMLYLSFGMK